MSGKTLNYDEVETNKNGFHASKQPIVLILVDVNRIVKSDRFKHSGTSFKYFIGYADNNVIRPVCIMMLQMNGFIKIFYNGGKNISFMIKDDTALVKYSEIWNKVKGLMGKRLYSEPIYDNKYIKS